MDLAGNDYGIDNNGLFYLESRQRYEKAEYGRQMIVYNLTIHVEHRIHDEWLQWQREEHIPSIMATKQFIEYRFFHLLEQDETEGITYVMQLIAPTAGHYKKYIDEFAFNDQRVVNNKWGHLVLAFSTVMEVMH